MKIKALTARAISNSRGQLTVEAGLKTEQGRFRASVPSGTSKGKYEAVGVEAAKAVYNVREIIAPKLLEQEFVSQEEVDQVLVGLAGKDKVKLGVNAVLAVSIACCRALAEEQKLALYEYISVDLYEGRPHTGLPRPCVLLIEGGKHVYPVRGSASNGAQNDLDIQEFMAVPQGKSFSENYKSALEVYKCLKKILKEKFGKRGLVMGLESGFAPPLEKTEEALDLAVEAIKAAGLENEVGIGIDVAAAHFWEKGKYRFEGKERASEDLLAFYGQLLANYPISFIEDPFSEDDIASWGLLNDQFSIFNFQTFIVGDDLTVTNPERIALAKEKNACNGVIIKPNQIGTVTETLEAVRLAKRFGWKTIVSHRSGDTKDDFIADLAVGIGAEFIKSGGPSKPERVAKYNRLLVIEKEI